jgi:hypothetical protein
VVGICGGNYYSGFVCVDLMCELGEMDPKGIPHPACRTPCGPRTVGDRVEEELRVRGSGGLLAEAAGGSQRSRSALRRRRCL